MRHLTFLSLSTKLPITLPINRPTREAILLNTKNNPRKNHYSEVCSAKVSQAQVITAFQAVAISSISTSPQNNF